MTQATTWGVPSVGPASPSAMALRMNESLDAGLSGHRGTSRPDYAVAGTEWVKVVSSSIEQVMRFDGTNDILIGTYNPITHTWTPAGQGDTVIAVTASRTLDVNNALYVVDSSAGPVELTLLPGATAGEPFNNRIKWEAGANAVTYVPSGDNTINGATGAQTISAVGETVALSLDVDVDPDNWTSVSTVAGMQAANALAEIAALGLQATARANIGAAAASDLDVAAANRWVSVLDTPQATTTGTSKTFTKPAGLGSVRRVTIMLAGVSTNGSSLLTVRAGASGVAQASGYTGTAAQTDASTASSTQLSTGFSFRTAGAASVRSGDFTLNLADPSAYLWTGRGIISQSNTAVSCATSGHVVLSGDLDTVVFTIENGTDTFDAGSVNVLWEGFAA